MLQLSRTRLRLAGMNARESQILPHLWMLPFVHLHVCRSLEAQECERALDATRQPGAFSRKASAIRALLGLAEVSRYLDVMSLSAQRLRSSPLHPSMTPSTW